MSRMEDMINMEMLTDDASLSHVMIGHGLVDSDRETLR